MGECVRIPRAAGERLAPVLLVKRASGLEPPRGTVEFSLPTRKHSSSRVSRWACEQSLGLGKPLQIGVFIQRNLLEVIEEWVGCGA